MDAARAKRGPSGDSSPRNLAEALREFSVSDDLLLSPSRMVQHSDNWVAALGGSVVAVSPDLGSLVDQLNRESIPLCRVAIRFIEKGGMAAA
jgi:hypothetical protein